MKGILLYDYYEERYYIKSSDGQCWHLHCGECLLVWVNYRWVATRIEMRSSCDWYLVGLEEAYMNELPVIKEEWGYGYRA